MRPAARSSCTNRANAAGVLNRRSTLIGHRSRSRCDNSQCPSASVMHNERRLLQPAERPVGDQVVGEVHVIQERIMRRVGADQLRRAGELRGAGERKRRLDAIAVAEHRQAVADREHLDRPAPVGKANAEQRGEAAFVERCLLHPGQAVAVVQLAKLGDRGRQPLARELRIAGVAAHQNPRPRRRVEGHRSTVAQRVDAIGRAAKAVLVVLILALGDAERQGQARFRTQLRGAAHRSATSLGRVPISKKSTTHCGSPLKMKPRDPSLIV